jgi:hypothetical protein
LTHPEDESERFHRRLHDALQHWATSMPQPRGTWLDIERKIGRHRRVRLGLASGIAAAVVIIGVVLAVTLPSRGDHQTIHVLGQSTSNATTGVVPTPTTFALTTIPHTASARKSTSTSSASETVPSTSTASCKYELGPLLPNASTASVQLSAQITGTNPTYCQAQITATLTLTYPNGAIVPAEQNPSSVTFEAKFSPGRGETVSWQWSPDCSPAGNGNVIASVSTDVQIRRLTDFVSSCALDGGSTGITPAAPTPS